VLAVLRLAKDIVVLLEKLTPCWNWAFPVTVRVDVWKLVWTLVPIVKLETAKVLVLRPGIIWTGKVPPEMVETFRTLLCSVLVRFMLPITLICVVETVPKRSGSLNMFIVDALKNRVEPIVRFSSLDDAMFILLGEKTVRVERGPPPPPKLIRF
jgi:hypothetical protein